MKSLFVAFLMVFSLPTFAKMTVFNSADAAKAVLNDEEALAKIYKKSNTDNFLKIAVESEVVNEFNVTVETSKLDWRCETVVKVKSAPVSITLPNGAKIQTNKLVVSKVSASNCIE